MAKKSFNQKLQDSKDMPVVKKVTDAKTIARYGGENMLIAAPLQYDELMRRVPAGKLTTAGAMREFLAQQHNADFTCPMTAGIFISLAAQASEERAGQDETPYWRTLKANGELNEKHPGGLEAQKIRLEAEGHTIVQKGKRMFVENYEQKLAIL